MLEQLLRASLCPALGKRAQLLLADAFLEVLVEIGVLELRRAVWAIEFEFFEHVHHEEVWLCVRRVASSAVWAVLLLSPPGLDTGSAIEFIALAALYEV